MAGGKQRKQAPAPASTLQVDLDEGLQADQAQRRWKSARKTLKPWILAGAALLLLLAGIGFVATRPPAVEDLQARWVAAFESGTPQARADAVDALLRHHPHSHATELALWHEAMWKGARTQAVLGLRNQTDDAQATATLFAQLEPFRPEDIRALGSVVPDESELLEPVGPEGDTAEDAPLEGQVLDATRRAFAQRLSAWKGLPEADRHAFGAGNAADFVSTHLELAYPQPDADGKRLPVPGVLARGVWDGATCLKEAQLAVHRAREGYGGLFKASLDSHDAQISVLLLKVEQGSE